MSEFGMRNRAKSTWVDPDESPGEAPHEHRLRSPRDSNRVSDLQAHSLEHTTSRVVDHVSLGDLARYVLAHVDACSRCSVGDYCATGAKRMQTARKVSEGKR